jgi:hypothetical protein
VGVECQTGLSENQNQVVAVPLSVPDFGFLLPVFFVVFSIIQKKVPHQTFVARSSGNAAQGFEKVGVYHRSYSLRLLSGAKSTGDIRQAMPSGRIYFIPFASSERWSQKPTIKEARPRRAKNK